MDFSSLSTLLNNQANTNNLTALSLGSNKAASLAGLSPGDENASGTMFEAMLNSAIDNLNTTDSYLNAQEAEEIRFAMGETENTHDLMIAASKASTALSYTVALRDRFLQAYREIMQIQI
jgi:flagellar hook-basal body complex protein FliE